ncbi:MAG: HAD family hydrolase [Dehalococcoidales bacterium]|nr:HAD family hydrolase [Dehalococcoidales bacterium]
MIKAIIFDLDGVIIESAGIKTEAFRTLFADYPDKLPQIMAHHEKNAGISRYVKFRYFYEKILGKELTPEREKELGEEFSQIVLDKILKAPFAAGVMKFLKENVKRYRFFIASGTPEEELKYILKQRRLEKYFRGAYGTPQTKTEITRRILDENNLSAGEAVFVGDAESDLTAARETGVIFVARADMSDNTLDDCTWRIQDFTDFEAVLAKIEKTVPAST